MPSTDLSYKIRRCLDNHNYPSESSLRNWLEQAEAYEALMREASIPLPKGPGRRTVFKPEAMEVGDEDAGEATEAPRPSYMPKRRGKAKVPEAVTVVQDAPSTVENPSNEGQLANVMYELQKLLAGNPDAVRAILGKKVE